MRGKVRVARILINDLARSERRGAVDANDGITRD